MPRNCSAGMTQLPPCRHTSTQFVTNVLLHAGQNMAAERMASERPGKSDDALVLALACGATAEAAAAKAGVSRRTVFRRLADEGFRKRLRNVRQEMVERCSGMLTAASMEAVRTLMALMEPVAPYASRLGAAKAVLELGVRLRDLTEIEQRLSALEGEVLDDKDQQRRLGN